MGIFSSYICIERSQEAFLTRKVWNILEYPEKRVFLVFSITFVWKVLENSVEFPIIRIDKKLHPKLSQKI